MRKMVILPYDQYLQFMSNQLHGNAQLLPSQNPSHNELLDKPANLAVSQSELKSHSNNNCNNVFCMENNDSSSSIPTKLHASLILAPFNNKYRIHNAEALLKYIEANMDWNEKGELIIRGDVIRGSHVTDLMKDCLSKHKKGSPIGCEEFYSSLYDNPLTLVLNTKRHPLIGRGALRSSVGSFTHAPPPGVPVHKRFRYLDKDTSWIAKWNSKSSKT